MKTLLPILTLLILLTANARAQAPINVCADCNNLTHDFDFNSSDDSSFYYFHIDTAQANNLWQTGHPSKTLFTNGYSGPRALVTDTVNPYPPDNVSSFQFSVLNCSQETSGGCGAYGVCYVYVTYKMNSDSLMDGGTIEVSHNGSPFINLIEDTLASYGGDLYSTDDTVAALGKPGLSGTTVIWQGFGISYERLWGQDFDTITFRVTFASDAIQTGKDGWMIGWIQTGGLFEGTATIFKKDMIKIGPNPCMDMLQIYCDSEYANGTAAIFSAKGQLVMTVKPVSAKETINVSTLPDGVYFLQYYKDEYYTVKKLIINN